MKEPFIFDLDDTLVHTSFRYGIAIVELAKHMATYTSKDSREYERELANLEQVRKEVEEKKLSHEGLAALVEKTCSEGTKGYCANIVSAMKPYSEMLMLNEVY